MWACEAGTISQRMRFFFLLTVGSLLLTVELFYLQLTILVFLLTVGAESVSNKGLKGL